ncbi:MAG: hypothetical protein U0984_17280 [Prosthecobacter sp.]|nr:hypothetical protein [Prosthecobacter sp.]
MVILAGAVLAALPRRRDAGPESADVPADDDALWPKAPAVPPFVPHTRAWDDLRAALAPVVHPPEPETDDLPSVGSSMLEATNPFIMDDEPSEEPPLAPLPPPPPFIPRTLLD